MERSSPMVSRGRRMQLRDLEILAAASTQSAAQSRQDVGLAVKFTSTPPARTRSRSATIEWKVTNGAEVKCALDAEPMLGCSEAVQVQDLKPGTHTFSLTAERMGRFRRIVTSWKVVRPERHPQPSPSTGTNTQTTTTVTTVATTPVDDHAGRDDADCDHAGVDDSFSRRDGRCGWSALEWSRPGPGRRRL